MNGSQPDGHGRLEQLFEQHYAAVLAYALRRAPRGMAEDVASETFVVVSRRIENVPADALPWLYGVARRVLANERRGQARREQLTHRLELATLHAGSEDSHGDGGRVLAALSQLPESDREALMLVCWEGLSSAQAATAAGCSRVAIRARVSRARRRLAHLLDTDAQPTSPSPTVPREAAGAAHCSVIERSN